MERLTVAQVLGVADWRICGAARPAYAERIAATRTGRSVGRNAQIAQGTQPGDVAQMLGGQRQRQHQRWRRRICATTPPPPGSAFFGWQIDGAQLYDGTVVQIEAWLLQLNGLMIVGGQLLVVGENRVAAVEARQIVGGARLQQKELLVPVADQRFGAVLRPLRRFVRR